MKKLFASRGAAAASASLLTLLLAGGGYAIAAGGGTTLHACAKKSGGALRLASKCRKGERRVSWSTQGPAGPRGAQGIQGPQGAQGAQGAQGPQGPSAAYSAANDNVVSPTGTTPVTVTSLALPAGKYALAASVRAADGSTTAGAAPFCDLVQRSNSTYLVDVGARIQELGTGNAWETTLSPVASVRLTAPDTIDLSCYNSDGTGSLDFVGARVTAISVATLNGS